MGRRASRALPAKLLLGRERLARAGLRLRYQTLKLGVGLQEIIDQRIVLRSLQRLDGDQSPVRQLHDDGLARILRTQLTSPEGSSPAGSEGSS